MHIKANSSYVLVGIIFTLLAGLAWWVATDQAFLSVEFNLAEMSPRGEEGGFAMPASGASTPTGLGKSCSSSGTQVTLYWSASVYQASLPYEQNLADRLLDTLLIRTAHAGGGGGNDSPGYGSGGGHGHAVPAPVQYTVRLNGSIVASGISNTSHVASISPDTNYTWSVQACAGGGCSSEQSASFVCEAPPTLTFTADQYTVPYNTETTLRWNSLNTNSCTASAAWSGSKPVSGSESTGPLTEQTSYYLQCSGPRGSTAPSAVTIGILYGTGANISLNCGSSSGKSVTVRKGQICPINWDVGTSNPANCELRAGAVVLSSPLSTQTGTYDWPVAGETTVILDCEAGNNTASFDVKILPEFQET